MNFRVIDKTTGEEPDLFKLAARVDDGLMNRDIESFALMDYGQLILCDKCGNWGYVDPEKENLKIIFE